MTQEKFIEICTELADKHFPKGKCKERGNLLVFIAELWIEMKKQKKEGIGG